MSSYLVSRISYLVFIIAVCGFQLTTGTALCAESYGITSAERPFLEGNYDKAVKESDRLIEARADHKDQLYYLKGLSQLKLNRFVEARRSFEELLSKYPDSSRAFDARVGIGDSFLLEGNTGAASSIYSDIIQKYPGNTNIEAVRKRLADCGEVRMSQPATNISPARGQLTPAALRFSVQVGSFKSKKNAYGLSKKLNGQGYVSYVDETSAMRDKMYRVKVGRLLPREEAEKLAAKLKVRGYPIRICPEN